MVLFGSSFITRILGMIVGIVVARIAGPGVVGVIAFGTAYVAVFDFLNNLFSTAHIKLLSEGKDKYDCVKTYSWLQGSSIILFFFLVSILILFQRIIWGNHAQEAEQNIVIIILLFVNIAGKLLDFNNVTFTATQEQVKANLPFFIKTIIWQLGRLFVILLGFKAIGLVSWNLFTSLLVLPLAWKYYGKLHNGRFDKELAKQYLFYVPPISLIVLIQSILEYADKLLLVYFSNTTELGYYSAAFSIGGLFLLVSRSIGMVFFPLFSKLIAENNWDMINKKIDVFHEFALLFIYPFLLMFIIIGKPLLLLILGEKYQNSIIPFMILLLATFVEIIGMPFGNILSGMGRFYLSVSLYTTKLILFFFSIFFFLSPKFLNLGAVGLALNLLTLNIAGTILFVLSCIKIGKIKFCFKNIYRFVIISCFSLVFSYAQSIPFHMGTYIWIPISFLYLLCIYGLLFVLHLINISNLISLLELLNIKSLLKYIKNELAT